MNAAPSDDFLAGMAASSRARVLAAEQACSRAALRQHALARAAPPPLRLSPQGFDLIAEVKLRSPAVGQLQGGDCDIASRVRLYAQAGAAVISVLTEPSRFEGSLAHLEQAARAQNSVPVMRKDFLVDPYQVYEARAAGAGGILVILRMLELRATEALLAAAAELQLFVLLEAFDATDLQLAAQLRATHPAAPLLVGVNCRDLVTLQVVPGRLESLAAQLPAGAPRVAESGLDTPADAARLVRAGYNMALVGSALMRATDPAALTAAMLAAGRRAAVPIEAVAPTASPVR